MSVHADLPERGSAMTITPLPSDSLAHQASVPLHDFRFVTKRQIVTGIFSALAAALWSGCASSTDIPAPVVLTMTTPDGAKPLNAAPGAAVPLRVAVRDGTGAA